MPSHQHPKATGRATAPPAPTAPLPQLAAVGFATADDSDRPHLPAMRAVADPWFSQLGQPQEVGDGPWERHLRRTGRGLPVAGAYERACDRAVSAVQRWRFHHFLAAIEAERPGADAHEWAAARAREVASGWPLHQRRWLAENALELLHRAYAIYDPARQPAHEPLAAWARLVLRSRLRDQFHRGRREAVLSGDYAAVRTEDWGGDELTEAFQALQVAIGGANFFPVRADGPDCFAVLLFELRVRLAERFARGGCALSLLRASDAVPWPHWAGPRRFLPGWPRLAEVWAEAVQREDIPDGTRRLDFTGSCVRTLVPEVSWDHKTRARWNQWVNRGKTEARERVAAGVWDTTLAVFFPDNEPEVR